MGGPIPNSAPPMPTSPPDSDIASTVVRPGRHAGAAGGGPAEAGRSELEAERRPEQPPRHDRGHRERDYEAVVDADRPACR